MKTPFSHSNLRRWCCYDQMTAQLSYLVVSKRGDCDQIRRVFDVYDDELQESRDVIQDVFVSYCSIA